jgi:hypothetical protein
MQHFSLAISLEDNEILEEEVKKAIQGAVRALVRETYQKAYEGEQDRIVKARIHEWSTEQTGWNADKTLHRQLTDKIDLEVKNTIGNITVTRIEIEQRIQAKFKEIDDKIDACLSSALEAMDLKKYIATLVSKEIKEIVSNQMFALIMDAIATKNSGGTE